MSIPLREQWHLLTKNLRTHQGVLVAFSGGCDSAFLLAAARRALGKDDVLAVTAVSPSLAEREKKFAHELARRLDVHHRFLETEEMNNPSYAANPSNRCFFCKDELFGKLAPLAQENRMVLVDGLNASDRSEIRPGRLAARAWGVVHPLDEARLDKRSIRVLSRWMGLPSWNKPASPCLSSRIPYGTKVTREVLSQIEHAESVLHTEGFRVLRVRHFGAQARIEVPLPEMPRLQEATRWSRIVSQLQSIGYADVVADPRGFKSGRLNENDLSDAHAYEKTILSA